MSERLEIRLFGGLFIQRGGNLIRNLVSRKAEALVAYLARQTRAQSREVLANLLWDDRTQEQAMGNLRVVLTSVRQNLGEAILVARQTVEFNPMASVWVDANLLETHLAAVAKQIAQQGFLAPALVSELEQTINQYQGEFLAGFSVREAAQFEAWMRQERERFQLLVQDGLNALVSHYIATGQYAAGIAWGQRWVTIDPLNETAQRQMLQLLGRNGQRNTAIQQFDSFRRRLIDELGVEPAPETVAIYDQLLETELETRPLPLVQATPVAIYAPLPHNLPTPLMPIVGRAAELAHIQERLLDRACRLLTLTGIGGVGKTRLVVEAGQQLLNLALARQLFADGIYFVRLERIDSDELLPSLLAEAVNFQFQSKIDPRTQLLTYLRTKHLLLVMDNFEHLVDHTEIVLDILHQAPFVKILATSRERLNFEGEWLLEVQGLPCPVANDATANLVNYPAAQLFIRSAQAIQPDFAPATQTGAIVQVCQQLEGLPLGLQLAAASVRTHSCQQIVEEIQRNHDFLATRQRNLPERHRTLRAVFEHSWALLSAAEQMAFQKMAIFEGSFTAEAALQVAGVTLPVIQLLIDKSLLQKIKVESERLPAASANRYKIHRTLFPYVDEKLQATPAVVAELREHHCIYYTRFLHGQAAALKGADAIQALSVVSAELENVRAAWRYAATQGKLDCLSQSIDGLSQFYLLRGPLPEGQVALQLAIDHVNDALVHAPVTLQAAEQLLSQLTVTTALFFNERGLYEQAIATAQTALHLAQASQHIPSEAAAYHQWGRALQFQGSYTAAQRLLAQGFTLAEGAQLTSLCAGIHSSLGVTLLYLGDYLAGRQHQEAASQIYQQLGERYSELRSQNSLAMVHLFSGDYSAAKAIYERCLRGFREIGDQRMIGLELNNLGAVYYHLGHYELARRYYMDGLTLKRAIGDRPLEGLLLANLGLLTYLLGDQAAALAYSQEALAVTQESGERDIHAYARMCMGHAFMGLGRLPEAAAAYRQAVELRQMLAQHSQALEPLAGLAAVYLAAGDLQAAQATIEQIVPHLNSDALAGVVESLGIYLTCYRVLAANQDRRAMTVLRAGVQLLQNRAARISDAESRHSYLENVVAHRALLAAAATLNTDA